MHWEPKQFIASVKRQYPEFFTGKKVLEVGSLDINGSVRPFFSDCDYTGIDLGEGAGVDLVMHVADLRIHANPYYGYDVIVSTEALEHDAKWGESLTAMRALLKPNGLLLVTCAAPNRPEHGTTRTNSAEASPFTSDYYRNISIEDFASVLPANLFSKSYLGYRGNMDDLYFAGIKQTNTAELLDYKCGHCDVVLDDNRVRRFCFNCGFEMLHRATLAALTITAEISTKDRYTTTLPMCISAILMQTHKPDKLVIYDDGEQKDLTQLPPFAQLLQLALNHFGIQWVFYSTERKGQVVNHQHALDNATTELIWRVDDDEIPEPNCLENLLVEMKDGIGAVAGLVHHPNSVVPLPEFVNGGLEDIALGVNLQWYSFNSGPREVDHLYSTFLYSIEAARKAGGYPKELSVVGHREESWFTIAIKQAGYKLIVTPHAKTWHLRQNAGGIRSYSDTSLWEHDDLLFQQYLKAVGHVARETRLAILDSGIGDHLLFRALLVDEFKRKYPDRKWTLAVCFPEVFQDIDNVTIISIAEAKLIVGDRYQSEYSLYDYGWRLGNGRHILDVMREFYA